MSRIKSYDVGNGDMFYIRHNSDNFTIIDCCINDDRRANILPELATQSRDKSIVRFISTHPDDDHIRGLTELDEHLNLVNFYVVDNNARKSAPTDDFNHYVELRDSDKAFHLYKGVRRKWMNITDGRGSAGLTVWWPDTSNSDFLEALDDAAAGASPNNISPIIEYSLQEGVNAVWMGDLETEFMEAIEDHVNLTPVDILFAPHHGRLSGRVPPTWLEKLQPKLVVIGNAPSEYLHYYDGYNTITQNTAGDILFECEINRVDVYVNDENYQADYLQKKTGVVDHLDGLYYIGSLNL